MTDLFAAYSRLIAWVRDYGDTKQKVFVDDLNIVLAAVKEKAIRIENGNKRDAPIDQTAEELMSLNPPSGTHESAIHWEPIVEDVPLRNYEDLMDQIHNLENSANVLKTETQHKLSNQQNQLLSLIDRMAKVEHSQSMWPLYLDKRLNELTLQFNQSQEEPEPSTTASISGLLPHEKPCSDLWHSDQSIKLSQCPSCGQTKR